MQPRTRLALLFSLVGLITWPACEGPRGPAGDPGTNGNDGTNALTRTSTEAAGSNCADGGLKIEVGLDKNSNGQLDDDEVIKASTTYVCDGTGPNGKNALVKVSAEPEGTNCPNGGSKIESGIDKDSNGTLDPGEVDAAATTYVCNGGTPGPSGSVFPSTGINVEVKEVSKGANSPITVRFMIKDDRGFPVDLAGKYSVNTEIEPRFALAWFTKDAKGNVTPLNVYTKSISSSNATGAPTAYRPSRTGQGSIKENGSGAGDYTYTFPDVDAGATGPRKVVYDSTKMGETHVVWIQITRQTDLVYASNANTFYAANHPYYYIPSGTGTPLTREIVSKTGCYKCHDKFKLETTTSSGFHGGGRMDPGFCNVCHNPARTQNADADSRRFIHRVHYGSKIATANRFHGLAVTYPQDIRNCTQCHESGAAQGDQWKKAPTRLACGSCHDYVEFATSTAPSCTDPPTLDSTSGLPIKCKHVGGVQTDDTACANCHTDVKIAEKHQPVLRPDPNNAWLVSGGNTRTNAAWLAAAGYVPTGAAKITYEIDSVKAVDDSAIAPNKRLQITFKLKKDGTDVVFQTASSTVTEMMQGFVGAPSVYFAFAVPQDGNNTPADFNGTASAYIKSIWDGTATGSGAGTITGPDASGFYTITLTGRQIPPTATMLTGGVGYTYSLSSTPPLTQVDLAAYPYNTNSKKQGGLIVVAPNLWKVGDGFSGRRAIVDNDKCKNCHGQLGVAPSFHAGQRNDAPTCSFCHVPDRASSGWAAGSRYFIHAIHAGRKRYTPYTFHAASATSTFGEVEFPSPLNDCKVCHLPNTYDFTASANLNAIPNMMLTTVATGVYDSNPATNSSYYTLSPYVTADGVYNYGSKFSYNSSSGSTTQAAASTLVITPITTACSACHDSPTALMHMKNNGGQFYAQRSAVLAAGQTEGCILCHGPGRIAAIGAVHNVSP